MAFIMQQGSIVFTVNHLFVRSIYRPTADEMGQSQTLMLHSQGRMSGSLKQFHCFDSHVDNNCDTLTYDRVVVEFISIMTL